ncbi:hypothetical protein ACFO3D_18180 [Virgibacillus kekensis]|uniref:Uncharacterized protein n=1 Tax=Virgibacillus kekensis TaxID=202261 RepID=A0ABV9DMI1_9BACI
MALLILLLTINLFTEERKARKDPELVKDEETESINEETNMEPESKYQKIHIEIDSEVYQDFFNDVPRDASSNSKSKTITLIERAAMSVNPKGETQIPDPEKLNSFFDGGNDELMVLHQKNNTDNTGKLIRVLAEKPFVLKQARDLVENERIKNDLNYLAKELFKLEFYRISEMKEFITAYEKYVSIQKKILKIYYAIESVTKIKS